MTEIEARDILNGMTMAMNMSRLDARLILGLALGRDGGVLPHEVIALDDETRARLEGFARRRMAGEPFSRIKGRREFYGLDFHITPATLDPRPDSEVAVAAAIAWLETCESRRPAPRARPALRVLDLGTGSGCLLLGILHHVPGASGIGVDISDGAIGVARRNAVNLGLESRAEFITGNWDDGIDGDLAFDCVIANPPYIRRGAIAGLMDEVRGHDPHLALDGGMDGLDAIRAILPRLAHRLGPDGHGFIEIGEGQAAEVQAMIHRMGLEVIAVLPDLAGIDRCVVCRKKSARKEK